VFPPTYDLRDLGRSTPAWGSDCPCGMCWTSAALGSLESSIAPWTFRDLSENHLQLGGWDDAECLQGGSAQTCVPYFASWRGPVDHADFNACAIRAPGSLSRPVRAHVQNIYFLPQRDDPLDHCWLKWAVMHLGGLYAAVSHGFGLDLSQNTLYYPFPGGEIHAVTLIGWDDAFDRNRFFCPHPSLSLAERIPPGDGAFLVKEVSGPTFGDQGHIWVSYYDRSFAVNAVAFTGEPVGNYSRNYQYDPYGTIESLLLAPTGAGAVAAWQGNVFTAEADEYVAAVSLCEFYESAMDYEIRVYLDPTNGPVHAGAPAATCNVSLVMKGYYTIKLPSPVLVRKGQRFSVVLRGRERDHGWPGALCLERPGPGASLARASPGQSYVSTNGATWQDLTTVTYQKAPGQLGTLTDTNLRIRAFTTPVLVASASLARGDLSVTWQLRNDGTEGMWARPEGQQRIQVGGGFEDVGDPFTAETSTNRQGEVMATDGGWVFVPPGETVTAASAPYAAELAEQIAWRNDVVETFGGLTISQGIVQYINDLLATPLHVLSSDPGAGAQVSVPFVPVLTVTYDAPLQVGPGLLGITVSSGNDVRSVYAVVQGSVLQIVPAKPLSALPGQLGGTTWQLHVPKNAVLSANQGNPLVNPFDISFTVTGVN
jgi:C1A family cysteine protease